MVERGSGVNLGAFLEAVAQAVPDRVAVVHRERKLTFEQLVVRTRRVANALLALGVPPPRPRSQCERSTSGQAHVAVIARNRPEHLEILYGAFGARWVPANVNYRYTSAEAGPVLADIAPSCLMFETQFAELAEAIRPALLAPCGLVQLRDADDDVLVPGARWYEDVLAAVSDECPGVEPSGDDGYLLYTGGTTGMPKGVLWRQADLFEAAVRPYKGAVADVDAIAADPGGQAASEPARTVLALAPLMHGAAQWAAMSALHGGDTVVMQDVVDRLDPADVWRTVERHGVQAMTMVGDAFARPLLDALRAGSYDTSSLMLIASGGARLSEGVKAALIEALPHVLLVDGAGASEAGNLLTNVSIAGADISTGVFAASPGTVIVSEDRTAVVPSSDLSLGWLGRIGPMPLGYLNDPAKTARTFIDIAGQRIAVPGDRARWRDDGLVELVGRDSMTINSGGEKVFAEEVERALLGHPAVRDALVVGRAHERWVQEIVAVVQLAPGDVTSDEELADHCRASIARYKVPKAFLRVDVIRRSEAGKADYRWATAHATAVRS